MTERRRHPRAHTPGWLSFRFGDRIIRAPIVDLSISGVRAACKEPLLRGTYLEVSVEVLSGRPVTMAGLVVHEPVRRGDLALSFLSAGEASTEALSRVVAHAAASPARPPTADEANAPLRRSTDRAR